METKVKICCISSLDEARLAIEHGADALGLVGDMPSGPGVITDELARDIASGIPPTVDTFLLTSHLNATEIAQQVSFCGASTVQIVNHVDPAEYPRLMELLPSTRRVQVVHVEDESVLDLIDVYGPYVHAFLLDSGRPSASVPELGGTGRTHNWEISAEFVRRAQQPVFLAGGLNAGNILEAMRTVRPYGVDLCSSVRTDGKLDPSKLKDFMDAVSSENASGC